MTTWLALDIGDRRIGLAAGSIEAGLARPLSILERRSKGVDFAAIASQAEQVGAERLLVGLPLNMDGSEGPQARKVRNFADRLARRVDLPITLWDERLTSFEADLIMAETGRSQKGSQGHAEASRPNDAVAAAVLLQSYFDRMRSRDASPTGLTDPSGS